MEVFLFVVSSCAYQYHQQALPALLIHMSTSKYLTLPLPSDDPIGSSKLHLSSIRLIFSMVT